MILNLCFKVRSLILAIVLSGLGFISSAFGQTAVIVNPDGRLTYLGTLGGSWSVPSAINDRGQVVGESETTGGNSSNFITGPNGAGMRDLGALGGVFDMNESGQLVGQSGNQAFVTGPNGEDKKYLGTLGGPWSAANGINNAGRVVGWLDRVEGERQAFITGPNGEGITYLDMLPKQTSSEAFGINDAGQVVGTARGESETGPYGLYIHAFVTRGGWSKITSLGLYLVLELDFPGKVIGV